MLTTELISTLHFPRIKTPIGLFLQTHRTSPRIERLEGEETAVSQLTCQQERETGKWLLLGKQKCYNLVLLIMETWPLSFPSLKNKKTNQKYYYLSWQLRWPLNLKFGLIKISGLTASFQFLCKKCFLHMHLEQLEVFHCAAADKPNFQQAGSNICLLF